MVDVERCTMFVQGLSRNVTVDTSVADAETAITTAMDKSDLANAFVHP
jgi:hypothetical protein